MKRILSILMCIIACAMHATAQEAYAFQNIGIKQGLSNGFVDDMVMDDQGFIWTATESGLYRIAGNKCTSFKTSNSDISSDDHTGLFYHKGSNSIWLHFKDGHINRFDCKRKQFSYFRNEEGFYKQTVVDINSAADGGLWIAFYDGTIQHYDPTTRQFTTIDKRNFPQNKNGIRSIYDDGKDRLYIGLRMDGMYIYNLRTGKSRFYRHAPNDPCSLPGNNVRTVFCDHLQNVWIGTNMGLALFDPSTHRFRTFKNSTADPQSLAGDNVHGIFETAKHQLWIASDIGGISILDLDRFTTPGFGRVEFRQVTKENSQLSSNNPRRIIEDTYGNIWIANYSTGVDFLPYTRNHFHTLRYNGKVIDNVIGLHADRQGSLWIGQDNIVSRYKNGTMQSWNIGSHLTISAATIYVFYDDHEGNIWLGTNDNGAIRLNPHTGSVTTFPMARNLDIHAFCEDRQHKMWIGSEDGLYSYADGTIKQEEGLNRQLGNNTVIFGLREDAYGQLWVGTMVKGLFVFNKNGKCIAHLNEANKLPSNSINHLYTDEDGGIWIATFKGLCHVPDPRHPLDVRVYDERQGIKDAHIRGIAQDRQGNIWVSMFSGVACFDQHKQKFYNYDYENGIPTGNFVEASAATMPDGSICFGSPGGICYFNPQLLSEQKTVSPVQIIDCERLASQSDHFLSTIISPEEDGTIRLSHNDNTFKIAFTAKDFSQEGNIEYAYRMGGLDNQWYDTDGDKEVTFRNLKPGSYTFTVRAKLKNRDWEEASYAEQLIVVCPPLWLTWWAKLCYTLIVTVLVCYFFHSYKQRLQLAGSLERTRWESMQKQELNEERLRFFTNITHELRTPLTLIMGPLEDIADDNRLPDLFKKKLKSIQANADRLLNLINDLLEFRKAETQNRRLTVARADLGALVKETGVRFQDLNHNPKLNIHVDIDPTLKPVFFDSEVVTVVINNFMSNAIKYTPEGEVRLSVEANAEGNIAISVADTGYGIDKEAMPHIYSRYYQAKGKHQASGTGIGLALVKSLAQQHEAQLAVESEPGKGSKFAFILNAANTYPNALHKDDEDMPQTSPATKEKQEEERPILLIVEDNIDIRQYIAESLHEDYRILQAANGKEGHRIAVEQIPDIIVSDIMMPEMDGIEMTALLKQDIRTSHIPIILLTAKNTALDQEKGYDSGADSYLTKPFSARLLHSRIRNILSSQRRLAESLWLKDHTANTKLQTEKITPTPNTEETPLSLSTLDQRFLTKLNALIEDNMSTVDLDIAFMTDKMAMSHSTFYRKVKALTGMSANEYIRKAKLHKSMILLQQGEMNVTEVAMQTGFNNLGNFREAFKKEYGMKPSEVKR